MDEGVEPDVGIGGGVEGSVAESLDDFVQALGELGDLGFRETVEAQGLDQVIDISSGDALDIGFTDDGDESFLTPAPGLEEPVRVVGAGAELWDGEVDGADAGIPSAIPVSVAVVGPLGHTAAIGGPAEGIRFGAHELLCELGHHRSEQIVAFVLQFIV
jgi:hypothetical protein